MDLSRWLDGEAHVAFGATQLGQQLDENHAAVQCARYFRIRFGNSPSHYADSDSSNERIYKFSLSFSPGLSLTMLPWSRVLWPSWSSRGWVSTARRSISQDSVC